MELFLIIGFQGKTVTDLFVYESTYHLQRIKIFILKQIVSFRTDEANYMAMVRKYYADWYEMYSRYPYAALSAGGAYPSSSASKSSTHEEFDTYISHFSFTEH